MKKSVILILLSLITLLVLIGSKCSNDQKSTPPSTEELELQDEDEVEDDDDYEMEDGDDYEVEDNVDYEMDADEELDLDTLEMDLDTLDI